MDEEESSGGGGSHNGFMNWLHQHPQLALAVGVVAVLLIAASFIRKNQAAAQSGTGPQQSDNGITTLGNGYSVVPTTSTDASTGGSYTAPDNTAATIAALAQFVNAVSPNGVASPTTDTTTTTDPNSTAADLGALQGIVSGLGIPTQPTIIPTPTQPTIIPTPTPTVVKNKGKHPKATHHTTGTPNQAPGTPIVKRHPANPSPMPPARSVPVAHPSQGRTTPSGSPTTGMPHQGTPAAKHGQGILITNKKQGFALGTPSIG